jgi:hypothetical protein
MQFRLWIMRLHIWWIFQRIEWAKAWREVVRFKR